MANKRQLSGIVHL